MEKCFACGKKIKSIKHFADTRDDQIVYVGSDCFKKIISAGENGLKLNHSGLSLYPCKFDNNGQKIRTVRTL